MNQDQRLDYLLEVAEQHDISLDILTHFSKGMNETSIKTLCDNAANLPEYVKLMVKS